MLYKNFYQYWPRRIDACKFKRDPDVISRRTKSSCSGRAYYVTHFSFLMIVRSSRSRPRHPTLSPSALVAVVLVLSFVEQRSDEVKNTGIIVSQVPYRKQAATVNLRADNGSDECSPRQFAVRSARDDLTSWTKTGSVFLTTWSTGAAVRSSENGDSDESADKTKIQEHQ